LAAIESGGSSNKSRSAAAAPSKHIFDGLTVYRGEHYCQNNEKFV
jgi:hypothetical protein